MSLEIKHFKLPRFQLLGASDCKNPSAISKMQILEWQKQGIIEYLGAASDVRPFLESSSCVVLPSFYKEGVPRVLLEAMSMGKLIITTNIAGCKECVAPPFTPYKNLLIGQNGILIPPKDVNALALAISLLISNKLPYTLTLAQMGANARAFVKGRFDIVRIIDTYVEKALESSFAVANSVFNPNSRLLCDTPFQGGTGGLELRSHPLHPPIPRQRFQSSTLKCATIDFMDSANAESHNKNAANISESTSQKPTPKTSKTQSPTKLVFVSNTCFGMYNFRLQVLKSLQKSGFAIHIIAPFDSSTRSLEQEGFSTHNLYLDSRSLNPLKDFRTITMLHKLLKQIRPALVFNYTIKPAIYSSSVCNFLKIPNIALITGLGYVFINDKGKNCSIKKRVLRSIVCLMYRFALKKTQEVWFLNNDDKQEFLSYKLIKQNQAFLLDSEGVDTEYFSPKNSDVKAQEQGEIVFLLIARMLWDKGVGEFVEAAKMVQESMKEANKVESNGGKLSFVFPLKIRFQLLGASDCENPSAISGKQILEWQKQGIIEYLGSTQDVRPFLESSSCVVLPSYREGVSVSLLEAMSMGKPIITSNASGCKHLVREFDNGCSNGFLCEVRDAKSLANAMREFIALDSTTREIMGQNARDFVCENYNIQRIIDTYHHACVSRSS